MNESGGNAADHSAHDGVQVLLEPRLNGRRIVITGAGSGIGRATAQLFAAHGASIAILDRDLVSAENVAKSLGGHAFGVDITHEAEVAATVDAVEDRLGGIDGLVNAAGIMATGRVEDVPSDAWRRIIEVNLTGSYIVTRCCLPALRRGTGSTIVNIASAQGLLPNSPAHTAYAASKGGVVNLSRALAAELARRSG